MKKDNKEAVRHTLSTEHGLEDAIAETDSIEEEVSILALRIKRLKEILHQTRKGPQNYTRFRKAKTDGN